MRFSRAYVNECLRNQGIDAVLQKGKGYFYFTGPDVELCFTTTVCVNNLTQMTPSAWLEEAKKFKAEHEGNKAS